MSLRDLPYLKLYVQDIMTDEKLIECSAAAQGIYLRIMCLMHKSERYGTILLKQKDKQKDKQILNFASKLALQLPFTLPEILAALEELISEKVLHIEDDFLVQKRMEKDGQTSINRSKSGSEGGKRTQKKNKENQNFAKANYEASDEAKFKQNHDYEYCISSISKEECNVEEIQEDKIEVKEGLQKKEFNKKPCFEDVKDFPKEKKYIVIEFAKIAKQTDITDEQVDAYWRMFKHQSLTGENFYNSENKVYEHFLNWFKKQDLSNGKQPHYTSTSTQQPKRTRTDALKDW